MIARHLLHLSVRLSALTALAVAPVAAQTANNTLVLTHANVVDGVSATVVRDATILISNGRIQSIRAGGAVPADVAVIDLGGRWVAPGLIDAHTHILHARQRAPRTALGRHHRAFGQRAGVSGCGDA